MRSLILSLSPDLVHDIAWTLVHFLWQGMVLAAGLCLILSWCRTARLRHDVMLGTLVLMTIAPLLTFFLLRTQFAAAPALAAIPQLLAPALLAGNKTAFMAAFPPVWSSWLVGLWLAGIALLCLRALGGWWLAESWRRHGTHALPDDLALRCRAMQQRLALTRPVRFLLSQRVRVPMVVGWFKPVVLFPLAAVTGLPPQQLDGLILHELAHILRRDTVVNVVTVAVETVLFYHPAVWWVARRLRTEREHACDDVAVGACGDVSSYVEALLTLETGRAAHSSGLALSLAASGGRLSDRVRRLLGAPVKPRDHGLSALTGLVFFAVVAATMATADPAISAQTLSIRIVDDSVAPGALQGPAGEDRVTVLGNPSSDFWLKRDSQITGNIVAEARVITGSDGKPVIVIRLTPQAQDAFAALTRRSVGQRLAVVVKDRVIIAPVVRAPITGGSLEIDANFASQSEAQAVVAAIMGTTAP